MDQPQRKQKANRIAQSLEPLLKINDSRAKYFGQDLSYFEFIADTFVEISSEKYNVQLYSCACYILFNMNVKKPDFRFDLQMYAELLSEVMPLFDKNYDKNQIKYAIFRYVCFILTQFNYKNIENLILPSS